MLRSGSPKSKEPDMIVTIKKKISSTCTNISVILMNVETYSKDVTLYCIERGDLRHGSEYGAGF